MLKVQYFRPRSVVFVEPKSSTNIDFETNNNRYNHSDHIDYHQHTLNNCYNCTIACTDAQSHCLANVDEFHLTYTDSNNSEIPSREQILNEIIQECSQIEMHHSLSSTVSSHSSSPPPITDNFHFITVSYFKFFLYNLF